MISERYSCCGNYLSAPGGFDFGGYAVGMYVTGQLGGNPLQALSTYVPPPAGVTFIQIGPAEVFYSASPTGALVNGSKGVGDPGGCMWGNVNSVQAGATTTAAAGPSAGNYIIQSGHDGVVQAVLFDGHVRGITASISLTTFTAAITPAGGEILGSDWMN
jgi:hypothetical protein